MILKVLQLSDWRVKQALQHEAIKGKKPIARGSFSMIFDGSKPNTVYKMTTDSFGYWMLNCWVSGVKHRHFPKAFQNFGQIGEIVMGDEEFPIYLFEMERLQKLERGTLASRTAGIVARVSTKSTASNSKYNKLDIAMFAIGSMLKTALPKSIKNALTQLEEFCCNYPGANLDMHRANFMMRKNGDLVISDPLCDGKAFEARHIQLKTRGY